MEFLKHRTIGISSPNLHIRILFLQVFTNSWDGPSCSDANDEMRDFPFGLFPDFRTCTFIMSLTVRQVIILITPNAIWCFFLKFLCHRIIAVWMICCNICWTNDYFWSKCTKDIKLLFWLLIIWGAKWACNLSLRKPKPIPSLCFQRYIQSQSRLVSMLHFSQHPLTFWGPYGLYWIPGLKYSTLA